MTSRAADRKRLRVRIVGVDLPGQRFNDQHYSGTVYQPLNLAVQRGREFEGLVPADAERAVFEFEVTLAGDDPDDVRGAHVQGRKGDRFFYLSWVIPGSDGEWEIVRRAKIRPACIPAEVWSEAINGGGVLEATLPLTDSRGGPLCASVDEMCRWRVRPD